MKLSVEHISLILKALGFASRKHEGQRRKGGRASPYVNHLIDVAEKLWELGGVHDLTTIVAGILHDTIEDTTTTPDELASAFGSEICSIVLELSDDKSLPKPVRKRLQVEHAGNLSSRARLVKIADKISNIHDIMDSPPVGWSCEERLNYIVWAEEVINRLRGTNENLERYFDTLCSEAKKKINEEKNMTDNENEL